MKLPFSREDAVDPEEMLVASLSTCHMLFFLDLRAAAASSSMLTMTTQKGLMAKDERGRMAMTRVTLKPRVTWSGDKQPSAAELADLHHKSHDACFIANSFRGEVVIDG